MSSIERVLIAYNPYSTGAAHVDDFARSLGRPYAKIQTAAGVADTQQAFYDSVQEGDCLYVYGGDGTFRQAVEFMSDPETAKRGLQYIPCIPARGGNANDNARSFNGKKSPAYILEHGRLVPMHPLEVTVKTPARETTVRRAAGYFSINAAACVAFEVDRMKQRGGLMNFVPRDIHEAAVCLRSAANCPPIYVTDSDGTSRSLGDRSFGRGTFIAKYGRLNVNPFGSEYKQVDTVPTNYPGTAFAMSKLAAGLLKGEMRQAETVFQVETDDGTGCLSQYDGDTVFDGRLAEIPSGSTIVVGVSARSFNTLTTRKS